MTCVEMVDVVDGWTLLDGPALSQFSGHPKSEDIHTYMQVRALRAVERKRERATRPTVHPSTTSKTVQHSTSHTHPQRGGIHDRRPLGPEVAGGNTRPIWTGFSHFSIVDRLLLADLPLQAELRC